MEDLVKRIDQLKIKYETLKKEIARKIVGQEEIIDKILVAIFSNGHCLLIGVPGLAKTLMVTAISETLDLKYKRIQFTPDLMPSDIIGTEILDNQKEFRFIEGPLFANIILADEINRTPPKTQSALLGAMQEQEITAAGTTRKLEQPFFVLATQNPIEQEGTYPLPEAQLDRFMFSLILDYPTLEEEIAIVESTTGQKTEKLNRIVTGEEIPICNPPDAGIETYHRICRKTSCPDSSRTFWGTSAGRAIPQLGRRTASFSIFNFRS